MGFAFQCTVDNNLTPTAIAIAASKRLLVLDYLCLAFFSMSTCMFLCCRALYWNIPGLVLFIFFAVLSGMVMYARYFDCDPKTMGYISSSDQVGRPLSFFVS